MNTRTNPNYPFKKRNYNWGSRVLFKPLERAARMADSEIRKARKSKNTSHKVVSTQGKTKVPNAMTNKRQWSICIAIIAFLFLFFAVSIPTGFIDSYVSIVVLIIGVAFFAFIGASIPVDD